MAETGANKGIAVRPELIQLTNQTIAYIVTTEEQWEVALAEFKEAMGARNFIGLDVEYLVNAEGRQRENKAQKEKDETDDVRVRNNQQGKDPLLQLGTHGLAILVRLCYFQNAPKSLGELLEDKEIVKVGVQIQDDVQRLKLYWKLRVRSYLDLRFVCLGSPRFCDAFHFGAFSLKAIGAFLGEDIYEERDWRLSASDWSATRLTHQQIEYAANDALAASGSYEKIVLQFQGDVSCKFHPKQTEFWKFFWEKRFRRYVNRYFNDNTPSKYSKHQEADGKLRALESRMKRSDMKLKQYRKLQEKMHNSDSDIDFDFEQEKQKKLAGLPPIEYVEFNEGDNEMEQSVREFGGSEHQKSNTKEQSYTGSGDEGMTECSECVTSSNGTDGNGALKTRRQSLSGHEPKSSLSSRSQSMSDSEALRSISESRVAEKVKAKRSKFFDVDGDSREEENYGSSGMDVMDMEILDETVQSSVTKVTRNVGRDTVDCDKTTEKTESSALSVDGAMVTGKSSGSGTSSGFAADISEYSDYSRPIEMKSDTMETARSTTVDTQISDDSFKDAMSIVESVEEEHERRSDKEEIKTQEHTKSNKGKPSNGKLTTPLLVEKDFLEYSIEAQAPSQTLTMLAEVNGEKHRFRVKISDIQVVH